MQNTTGENATGASFKSLKIRVLIVIGLILAAFIGINEGLKFSAVRQLEKKLSGESFDSMMYYYDLNLYDEQNDRRYRFYGSMSDFQFHNDNTVTWTCRYRRSNGGSQYTDPVTEAYGYKVKYLGDFLYDRTAVYVVLDTGDVLDVDYDSSFDPEGVNYSILHQSGLHASPQLMNIDTSYVSSSSGSYKTSGGNNSGRKVCSRCDGTGRVTKHYGKSWNDKEGYRYGQKCGGCDGTGYTD